MLSLAVFLLQLLTINLIPILHHSYVWRLVWNHMVLSIQWILAYCLFLSIEIYADFVRIDVYMLRRIKVITVLPCSFILAI